MQILKACWLVASLAATLVGSKPIDFASNTASIVTLQQTINEYPLAIDRKKFSDLSYIFTSDVYADYGSIGVYTNLKAMQAGLAANLKNVTTLHNFGTFEVTALTSTTAETTVYADAAHFGHGAYEGETFFAYGWSLDSWIKTNAGWRVKKRTIVAVGGTGNPAIFTPQ